MSIKFLDNSIVEKENFKFKQAQGIADRALANFNKDGKDEYYKTRTKPIPADTKDPLQRCYLWLLDNYYNNHKGYTLDAGCGVASFVLRLESIGYNVVGLDMYLSKINFCEMLRQSYPDKKINFTQGTVYSMPYFSRWFDVCNSTMVLEHLRDSYSGLVEMARVARVVTGIIHLGKHIDSSPWHTRFMTREKVEKLFELCKKRHMFKEYILGYLDTNICAMFIAISSPCNRHIDKGSGRHIKDTYCTEVEVEKIMCASSSNKDWEQSYFKSIEQYGKSVAESNVLPIRVTHFPEKDIYVLKGDGVHRVNALKKAGIKKVRVSVSYLEKIQ